MEWSGDGEENESAENGSGDEEDDYFHDTKKKERRAEHMKTYLRRVYDTAKEAIEMEWRSKVMEAEG